MQKSNQNRGKIDFGGKKAAPESQRETLHHDKSKNWTRKHSNSKFVCTEEQLQNMWSETDKT